MVIQALKDNARLKGLKELLPMASLEPADLYVIKALLAAIMPPSIQALCILAYIFLMCHSLWVEGNLMTISSRLKGYCEAHSS